MHISIYSNLLPIVITVCSAASISNEEIAKILGDRETLNSVRSINSMQDDLDEFKNRLGAMRDLPGEMDDNLYDTLETDDDNDDGVAGSVYDTKTLEDIFPVDSVGQLRLPSVSHQQQDRRPVFNDDEGSNKEEEEEEDISVEKRNPFCNRRRGCRGKRLKEQEKEKMQELVKDMLRKRFLCNSRRGCRSAVRSRRGDSYDFNEAGARLTDNSPCDAECQFRQRLINKYLFGGQTVKNLLAALSYQAMASPAYETNQNTHVRDNGEFEFSRNVVGPCGAYPCPKKKDKRLTSFHN